MKRLTLLLLFLILFGSFEWSGTISAIETNNQKTILIDSYEEDVTGNGQKEEIKLKGIRFSEDSNYFHNVWADVKGSHTRQWKIVYEGGYDPSLKFNDLNHDGVNDVLFQNGASETRGMHHYQLHTLKDEKLKELKIPESHTITGEFKPNFKASLFLNPGKDPIIIDMKDRSDSHIHDGIYDNDGKLLKKTHLLADPIADFESVYISKSKGYGLKSYQQVSGVTHDDLLGEIEALWYFENKKWIKLKQEWKPSS